MAKEVQSIAGFEPKIIAFLCNWCSYGGADLAGVSRLQYPANTRTIRVMCTATISPHHILKAFQKGADGVLVAGCHIGDCHYVEGNHKTVRKIPMLHLYLKQFGINPKRVKYTFVSASEGAELTEIVEEFVHELKELGPNPIKMEGK